MAFTTVEVSIRGHAVAAAVLECRRRDVCTALVVYAVVPGAACVPDGLRRWAMNAPVITNDSSALGLAFAA